MMYLLNGRYEMSLVTMAAMTNVMIPVRKIVMGVAIQVSQDDRRRVTPWKTMPRKKI